MAYVEFDGALDGEAPSGGFVPFTGELDKPKGVLERIKGALNPPVAAADESNGAVDPMTGIDPTGGQAIADPDPQGVGIMADAKVDPNFKKQTSPFRPEVARAIENRYDAATPEERADMLARPSAAGDVVRRRDAQFVEMDASVPLDNALDPRAEARSRRLAKDGMAPELAGPWGAEGARRGELPGTEVGTVTSKDVFDFDTQKKFNEDPFFKNPLVRGAVKGYEGYKQGIIGLNEFLSDTVGADDTAAGFRKMGKQSTDFTTAMGEPKNYTQSMFEGAVSSIAQQLPALIGGVVTGSEPAVLSAMFVQSYGQQYAEGRAAGQSIGEATTRASQMAAFEVIGEKLGLGQQLAGIKAAARGNVDQAVNMLAKAAIREVPGEELTTVGQFAVDKEGGGVGIHTEAGAADLFKQMVDTFSQTVIQGGLMTGGGKAVATTVNKFNTPERQIARAIDNTTLNNSDTGDIARAALDPQNRNAIPAQQTVRAPQATIADIQSATTVDDAIAAATAVVSEPVTVPVSQISDQQRLIAELEAQAGMSAEADVSRQTTPASADYEPNAMQLAMQQAQRKLLLTPVSQREQSQQSAPAPTTPQEQPDAPTYRALHESVALDPVAPAASVQPDSASGRAPDAQLAQGGTTDTAASGFVAGRDPAVVGRTGEPQPALTAAIPSKADDIAGEDLNRQWTAFANDSGSLGIPRAEMPQIKAEHRGAMVNFLNARGITHEQGEVDPSTLKPTQLEFSQSKVNKAKSFTGNDRSILISSDGHVLDGHHQWLSKRESGEPVKVIRLDAPIKKLLAEVAEFPSAEVANGATTAQQLDRRQDVTTRKSVAAMSADEMRQALLVDDMTGLGNKRAYNEVAKKPFQASIDIDSLKWVNDNLGHDAGDKLIQSVGQALREESGDAYHLSGDEFAAQFDDEQAGHALLKRVRDRLKDAVIEYTAPDGTVITKKGAEFSYGIANSIEGADAKLRADKTAREASGERAGRGAEPVGVVKEPAAGRQVKGDAAAEEVTPEPVTREEAATLIAQSDMPTAEQIKINALLRKGDVTPADVMAVLQPSTGKITDVAEKTGATSKDIATPQDQRAAKETDKDAALFFRPGTNPVDFAVKGGVVPQVTFRTTEVFKSKSHANLYRLKNHLTDTTAVEVAGGWSLEPKAGPLTAAEQKEARTDVAALNRVLKANGQPEVLPLLDVPSANHELARRLGKIFGTRIQFVSNNDAFDGVAVNGIAYLTKDLKRPELAIAGHEVFHTLEQTNPAMAEDLLDHVRGYLQEGVIEARQQWETVQSGESISERYAAGEVMADINGAMWLDPLFWREMLDRDTNLFRRVAYLFMETMSKAVESLTGTRFDVTALVTDADAVRKLIAQTWADRNQQGDTREADENGLAYSRNDNIAGMATNDVVGNSQGGRSADDTPSGAKPFDNDERASARQSRASGVEEDYRLPKIANVVPKEYVPKEATQKTVTIYRGVPHYVNDATIRPGDWVTFDKNYALQHGTGETGRSKIISMSVPVDHVAWAGTDMNEWFYAPREPNEYSAPNSDGAPAFSRAEDTIMVDGVERPTTNSDGKPIAYTKPILENFWRWFGDSKITDDGGKPLAVYHGSRADITEFKPVDGPYGNKGLYFTKTAGYANMYAGERGAIYPVYLQIKNPKIISNDGVFKGIVNRLAGRKPTDTLSSMWLNEPLIQEYMRQGYDGIVNRAEDEIVAFSPTQIKSATGNQGTFDPSNPDIRFSRKEPAFYSALARTVPDLSKIADKNGNIGAEQARLWLMARQKEGRFKADELAWSGLDDYLKLQGGKVAVADIEAFVRDNGVKVEEVLKSDNGAFGSVYVEELDNGMFGVFNSDTEQQIGGDFATEMEAVDAADEQKSNADTGTKFGKYTLPGGENYRELLLTLPKFDDTKQEKLDAINAQFDAIMQKHGVPIQELPAAARAEVDRLTKQHNDIADAPEKRDYHSSHFDEANILAHIRFNDRTDADGKKVLFIEELQSDWGQKGKKEGFKVKDVEAERERLRAAGDPNFASVSIMNASKIPAAPFVTDTKSWLSLGIKRMIRYAAENGYDKVAFINGRQSADRYDLSKQVGLIEYLPDSKKLKVFDLDGEIVIDTTVDQEKVEDYVGKEVAKNLFASKPEQVIGREKYSVSGNGLKIGGEGMKAFYDKIVPQVANDVLKKVGGGKVGEVTMTRQVKPNIHRLDEPRETKYDHTQSNVQPGFDITPAMRQTVMQGQPLFSRKESRKRIDTDDQLVNIYSEIARDDEAFSNPISESKSLAGVINEVAPEALVEDATDRSDIGEYSGNDDWKKVIRVTEIRIGSDPRNFALVFETTDNKVWIDIANWKQGGKGESVYQAVGDYAFNTGKKFIGDPMGLSEEAAYRRTEHMLSSALRHGTTEHLEPGKRQMMFDRTLGDKIRQVNWKQNDDAHNLRELLLSSYYNVQKAVPEIGDVTYNFASGRYEASPDSAARLVASVPSSDGDAASALLRPDASAGGQSSVRNESGQGSDGGIAQRGLVAGNIQDTGNVGNVDAVPFTDEDFDALAESVRARVRPQPASAGRNTPSPFGMRTLKRSVLTQTILRSESSEAGRVLLDRVSAKLLQQISPQHKQLLYSRKDAVKTVWDSPEPSKIDDFVHVMQDKHIDTKRVVQAIRTKVGEINDHWNPYLQEELFHGRSAKQVTDFLGSELRPLLQDMQARGIPMSDFEEYLHMRHAEERNNQIAKVNQDMPDGGSGVDTADARAYLSGLADNKKRAYESLAKRVDAINKATRRILIDSGLETPETIKAWEGAYQYYVPLQREEGGSGIGQGFSVRGGASKRAMGSKRAVVNILANLAMQRERTIVRAEKNRVSTALYGLAITSPNPDFWQPVNPDKIDASKQAELVSLGLNPLDVQNLIDEPKQQYIDQRTGLVAERVNPFLRSAPNVISTRVNGEDRYVFFNENDERAVRMVRTLKNLDADQLGRVLSMSAKVTRYFSSINTQYNPIFGMINLIRDSQEGMFNLSTTPIAGKQKQVMAYTVSALRGIYIDLRDHRAGKPTNSKWAAEFEEFQKEGGQTGYRNMFSNSQERADALKKELKAISEGKLKAAGRAVFDWLSDYNETMENAVRLAAYKVAKEQGLSKQQAASIAKSLTVNFNKKGMIATQAGALYAFFNAAVQGTARMTETLRGPAGKKIIAGGLLLGSMQALMLAAAGFSDDEPPEFIKSRNLVIPIGDGKYLTWPMPLGLKILPTIGRLMTEFALGGFKNPGKKLASLLDAFADTFNPIGNAGLSIQTLSPTALDPLVALSENRDWTGKPIARVDRSGLAPTPGYTRAKDTASEVSKALSYWINIASGGTKYKPGIVSPTPDQLDYLIGQATGGVGREAMKVEQTVMSQINGEDLPAYKIPLAGRFYGNTKEPASVSGKFYENLRELNLHEAEIKGLRRDKGDVAAYVRENPESMLVQAANNVDRDIQKLNHKKRELVKHGASKDAIKLVEQQANNRMAQFNDRVRSFVEKQKEKQAN